MTFGTAVVTQPIRSLCPLMSPAPHVPPSSAPPLARPTPGSPSLSQAHQTGNPEGKRHVVPSQQGNQPPSPPSCLPPAPAPLSHPPPRRCRTYPTTTTRNRRWEKQGKAQMDVTHTVASLPTPTSARPPTYRCCCSVLDPYVLSQFSALPLHGHIVPSPPLPPVGADDRKVGPCHLDDDAAVVSPWHGSWGAAADENVGDEEGSGAEGGRFVGWSFPLLLSLLLPVPCLFLVLPVCLSIRQWSRPSTVCRGFQFPGSRFSPLLVPAARHLPTLFLLCLSGAWCFPAPAAPFLVYTFSPSSTCRLI